MAETKSSPSLTASPMPPEPGPDPAIVAEMKAQGRRPVELAHVTWGEDLGLLLEKAGRITTETEENPASPSKRHQPQTTSDLNAPNPVQTT
jgi:hypothetical protein